MSRHVKWALNVWPFVFGALLILGAVKAEHRFFPVVEHFIVTSVSREVDGIIVSGQMVKERACDFIGVTAKADTGAALSLKFMDDDSPSSFTRPTGSQEWGPWKVIVPVAPRVNTVSFIASHSCHPFWVTRTDLATIVINGG